jgi:hypothetical protein
MSHEHEQLPGEAGSLEPIERLLAGFQAVAPQIDRDRLMFAAGRASIGPRSAIQTIPATSSARPTIWHASTAVLAATTLALAFSLWSRPVSSPSVARPEIARHEAPPAAALARASASPVDQQARPPLAAAHYERIVAQVAPTNYVRTREVALRMGLDAIGSPGGSGGTSSEAQTLGQWLSDFNRGLRTSAASGRSESNSAM